MPPALWHLAHNQSLDLSRPTIVAILNITPDSFSDGGRFTETDAALAHAERCLEAGAQILEVGAESTRPGAERITAEQQLARAHPVIEALAGRFPHVPLSIDTTRAGVAREAIGAGASIINDVSGAEEDASMLPLAAETGAGVVLMHRLRPPGEDAYSDRYDERPAYEDVVTAVRTYLDERAQAAIDAGVRPESIVLDPGLGFGKSVEQNMELIRRTPEIAELGYPVMSAGSRKSFLGRVGLERDSDPDEREPASVALTLLHADRGARLFRVHDVAAHAQALRIWHAVSPPNQGSSRTQM